MSYKSKVKQQEEKRQKEKQTDLGCQMYQTIVHHFSSLFDWMQESDDCRKKKLFYELAAFKKVVINAGRTNMNSSVILHDFSYDDYNNITIGNNEGNLDYNDEYIVFSAQKIGDEKVTPAYMKFR